MDTQVIVYVYNVILLRSLRKRKTVDTWNSLDESQNRYFERKKKTKEYILYDFAYINF